MREQAQAGLSLWRVEGGGWSLGSRGPELSERGSVGDGHTDATDNLLKYSVCHRQAGNELKN
jgi:hypothetical protein